MNPVFFFSELTNCVVSIFSAEYFSTILSVASVFISFLITLILDFKYLRNTRKDLVEFKIDKIRLEKELRSTLVKTGESSIEDYLVLLSAKIRELYPDIVLSIKVLLVKSLNEIDPTQSKVYIRYAYPQQEKGCKVIYTIAKNTDFSAIVSQKNDFIFISDIREYDTVSSVGYKTEDLSFKKQYNTTIVFPIRDEKPNGKNVIGFVCIASPQKMNNTKKNGELIGFMDIAASGLSKLLRHMESQKFLSALSSIDVPRG